jgi:predicted O-methyltransferase YrrM
MESDGTRSTYTFSTNYGVPFRPQWSLFLGEFAGRPGVRMLEIGSFEGQSAIWFLENIVTGAGSSITCVDLFLPLYSDRFDQNIAASGMAARVTKLRGDSKEVLPSLAPLSFDVLYVDGGHCEEEVWWDALQAWRLAKPGAIIIFDDYLWESQLPPEKRPQRAIDRFLARRSGRLELMHKDYQVIVRKLPSPPFRRFRRLCSKLFRRTVALGRTRMNP